MVHNWYCLLITIWHQRHTKHAHKPMTCTSVTSVFICSTTCRHQIFTHLQFKGNTKNHLVMFDSQLVDHINVMLRANNYGNSSAEQVRYMSHCTLVAWCDTGIPCALGDIAVLHKATDTINDHVGRLHSLLRSFAIGADESCHPFCVCMAACPSVQPSNRRPVHP